MSNQLQISHLISNFISRWSENKLAMVSVLLNVLRIVTASQSLPQKVPRGGEARVRPAAGGGGATSRRFTRGALASHPVVPPAPTAAAAEPATRPPLPSVSSASCVRGSVAGTGAAARAPGGKRRSLMTAVKSAFRGQNGHFHVIPRSEAATAPSSPTRGLGGGAARRATGRARVRERGRTTPERAGPGARRPLTRPGAGPPGRQLRDARLANGDS